jgi:hypothetical protein
MEAARAPPVGALPAGTASAACAALPLRCAAADGRGGPGGGQLSAPRPRRGADLHAGRSVTVEGSAFVAVPLAGMTLAQMGADVIRFDRPRRPRRAALAGDRRTAGACSGPGSTRASGRSPSTCREPEGQEIITALITAPGPEAGCFLTNLRVRGWMDYPALSARARPDHGLARRRRGVVPSRGLHGQPGRGLSRRHRAQGLGEPVAHVLPAWDCIAGQMVAMGLLAAERHRLKTGQGQLARSRSRTWPPPCSAISGSLARS